ncbi:MAG: hypothetical protein ACYC2O_05695, partial [Microthrixaceae bacterium]
MVTAAAEDASVLGARHLALMLVTTMLGAVFLLGTATATAADAEDGLGGVGSFDSAGEPSPPATVVAPDDTT